MVHIVVVLGHISLWTPNIVRYPEYPTGFIYTCLNAGQIPRRDLGVLAQREAPAIPKFLVLIKAYSRPGKRT